MKISSISCMGNSNQIGLNGLIPFESDLQRFKYLTMGKTLIMGRKTFESIGKVLKGRETIVLSNKEGFNPEKVWVAKTKDQAIGLARFMKSSELMICGGQKVYEAFQNDVTRLYLTYVDYNGDADTYFPDPIGGWVSLYKEVTDKDEFHLLEKL